MNSNMITRHARAFPLSDALCLPSGASKNEQEAPYRRSGVVISEQGFSCVPGRVRVKKLAQDYRIRLVIWNIGTLTGKTKELVDTMLRTRISIACFQETKLVGEKARELEDTGYKLYYTGKDKHRNVVGLDDLIKKQFWEQMDDVVQGIPFEEKLFIGGDFNGHVGVHKQGYEKVYGGLDLVTLMKVE
ncbi:uncharacterized protein LOC131321237 [Rhododendron vialii]|uniref:uncharacterized protein LOC131321237 n=1 Tax=Rhododendron vialii TaxID=182163 RepID=UPI00265D7969|nr:uncharacterized protein LOC131321237 [Rhododendron vialii]